MSKGHENKSWREQRKAVVRIDHDDIAEYKTVFQSLWMAAKNTSENNGCSFDTARKEIRKAISTGVKRYGANWIWKESQ